MSAEQQSRPCYVPSWDGDTRTDAEAAHGAHYAGNSRMPGFEDGSGRAAFHKECGGIVVFGLGEFCTGCEDENPEWEARVVVRRELPPCWTVTCDGPGEEELEDDESGTLHAPTRSLAEQWASTGYGWRFLPDGRAFCEEDAPPEAYLVGVNVSGQLSLDGAS